MNWLDLAAARRARTKRNDACMTDGANGTIGTGFDLRAAQKDYDKSRPSAPMELVEAFIERLAICTADGISEAEARRTAECEIGAELVRWYVLPLELER